MAQTLLQLVQKASAEMSLFVPTAVVGNSTVDVQQLYYLANALGDELMREYDWEALNTAYRFTTQYLTTTGDTTDGSAVITGIPDTTGLSNKYMLSGVGVPNDCTIVAVDSGTQVTMNQAMQATGTGADLYFGQTIYDMPSDYDRQIDNTHYDKSKRWGMIGPETAQQWEFLKSSYISTGPRIRYRIVGGYFQIWPITTTNEYLGFEYVSSKWARTGSTPSASFTLDTDTCIFPDRLMVSGLKKRYFEAKGFDSSTFTQEYMRQLDIAKANDAGSPTLSMAPKTSSVLIGYENIPDGSIYGQG